MSNLTGRGVNPLDQRRPAGHSATAAPAAPAASFLVCLAYVRAAIVVYALGQIAAAGPFTVPGREDGATPGDLPGPVRPIKAPLERGPPRGEPARRILDEHPESAAASAPASEPGRRGITAPPQTAPGQFGSA
jgi:hypothetical protein